VSILALALLLALGIAACGGKQRPHEEMAARNAPAIEVIEPDLTGTPLANGATHLEKAKAEMEASRITQASLAVDRAVVELRGAAEAAGTPARRAAAIDSLRVAALGAIARAGEDSAATVAALADLASRCRALDAQR
jgi:hypothetical protein